VYLTCQVLVHKPTQTGGEVGDMQRGEVGQTGSSQDSVVTTETSGRAPGTEREVAAGLWTNLDSVISVRFNCDHELDSLPLTQVLPPFHITTTLHSFLALLSHTIRQTHLLFRCSWGITYTMLSDILIFSKILKSQFLPKFWILWQNFGKIKSLGPKLLTKMLVQQHYRLCNCSSRHCQRRQSWRDVQTTVSGSIVTSRSQKSRLCFQRSSPIRSLST